jgi:hypothetical protein
MGEKSDFVGVSRITADFALTGIKLITSVNSGALLCIIGHNAFFKTNFICAVICFTVSLTLCLLCIILAYQCQYKLSVAFMYGANCDNIMQNVANAEYNVANLAQDKIAIVKEWIALAKNEAEVARKNAKKEGTDGEKYRKRTLRLGLIIIAWFACGCITLIVQCYYGQ